MIIAQSILDIENISKSMAIKLQKKANKIACASHFGKANIVTFGKFNRVILWLS